MRTNASNDARKSSNLEQFDVEDGNVCRQKKKRIESPESREFQALETLLFVIAFKY